MRYIKLLIAVGCLALLLPGCITNKYVFDKHIPEDELSTLIIDGSLTVVRFNGERVSWKDRSFIFSFNGRQKETIVRIPAGEGKITANYSKQNNISHSVVQTRQAKGLECSFYFESGAVYTLSPVMADDYLRLIVAKRP